MKFQYSVPLITISRPKVRLNTKKHLIKAGRRKG